MSVTVNEINSVKKELLVNLEAEQIEKSLNKAFKRAQKKAKIKGFRPGKAPMNVVKRLYREQVRMDVMEELVQQGYSEALQENDISPIAAPEIKDVDFPENDTSLSFCATVEILPEITIAAYDDIELEKRPTDVEDSEVDAELEKLQQSMAQFKTIDERPTQDGDTIEIDFTGRLNGEEFEGGSAENFSLELGSGRFIPDLERQLVGLELDKSYDLDTTFPEDYHKEELAGKETVFTVTVKSIKEKILSELNDDLAIQVSGGEMETVAALREKMTEYLDSAKEDKIRNQYTSELLAALRERCEFELPECMLKEEQERALSAAQSRFTTQGIPPEKAQELIDSHKEQIESEAADTVKNTLILEKMAELEKIESTPDEVGERFQKFIQSSGSNAQDVFEQFKGREGELTGMLQREVILDKTISYLLDKVSYKEPEAQDEAKTESASNKTTDNE
ncbi:MAG: trigger factor [Deltaproteobacteria bacterium]|nr:MAG: trigger factor [Deltaproteobacteria bacterium]